MATIDLCLQIIDQGAKSATKAKATPDIFQAGALKLEARGALRAAQTLAEAYNITQEFWAAPEVKALAQSIGHI